MDYKGFSLHELRSYFSYNPDTGMIVRLIGSSTGPGKAGDIAGSLDGNGYLTIKHKCEKLLAHRLAWFISTGEISKKLQIDHINGDRSDNRLSNIRMVTCAVNAKNRARSLRNTSGCTGVSWDKSSGKWHARISNDGKRVSIGVYDDLNDAIAARKKAEQDFGYHKNHDREATSGL